MTMPSVVTEQTVFHSLSVNFHFLWRGVPPSNIYSFQQDALQFYSDRKAFKGGNLSLTFITVKNEDRLVKSERRNTRHFEVFSNKIVNI